MKKMIAKSIIAISMIAGMALVSGTASAKAKGKLPQVNICHNGQTISVSLHAAAGHMMHGDMLGACTD